MSRAEQGKIVAVTGLGIVVASLGLHVHGWEVVMTAMLAGLCVTFFGAFYSRRAADAAEAARKQEEAEKEERQRKERDAEREERRAEEARRKEIFLNESVKCEAGLCHTPSYPRRQLWRLPDEYGGRAVCPWCFDLCAHRAPDPKKDKHAYE